jgi:hypothetical protein
LKVEKTLRTGRRQAGQTFNSGASSGRRKVNRPWQTGQLPSHNSYSYIGMADPLIADVAANCALINIARAAGGAFQFLGWRFPFLNLNLNPNPT